MKKRGRWTHDPNYGIKKYDRLGNINPAWRAIYGKPKVTIKKYRPKRA